MKKLLLVLLVVALASFLLVGCLGTGTTPAEDEDEDEGEVAICPTVTVADSVAISGKNYLKAGKHIITVTFAVPTEPVSVYIGSAIKTNPVGVPEGAEEVVMSTVDKKVYTGTHDFGSDNDDLTCGEGYIYVATCDTCAPCKTAFTVDEGKPYANIKITTPSAACPCSDDLAVKFDSAWTGTIANCVTPGGCCGDACSGLATWTIDIYDTDPYGTCCAADPCATVFDSCSGTGCPVLCTTNCSSDWFATATEVTKDFFTIIELKDKVGNSQKYYAKLVFDTDELKEVYEGTLDKTTCEWTWGSALTDWIIGIPTCPK